VDVYLQIDGIKGESTDSASKDGARSAPSSGRGPVQEYNGLDQQRAYGWSL
jgi:type VI protein secretion system component Hcp